METDQKADSKKETKSGRKLTNWKLLYVPNEALDRKNFSTIAELERSGYPILPALVPGNFEKDLMKVGVLEDLYFSTNTLKAQQLENMHVWYFTEFDVSEAENRSNICFEGIDTAADIYLNGRLIKSVENMYVPCMIDHGIREGKNELIVHIKPACLVAAGRKLTPHEFALTYNYESLTVRKAPHMYGWDIMPRIVSAGIWKDVFLIPQKKDEIEGVFFHTVSIDLAKKTAAIRLSIQTKLSGDFSREYSVTVKGRCKDSSFETSFTLYNPAFSVNFNVDNCKFWWPKNAGEAQLYDVEIILWHGDVICDTYQMKFGIRTVELKRTDLTLITKEGKEGEFCFRINGKKVFALGTNWVPLDAFHSNDLNRLPKALALLDDIGCNMVRCWGGNVYESDAFFDFCDSHGIMIWQDFAMACAIYPQDDAFADKLREEAIYQVKRLRNHASLVLWAGDNECDEAYYHSWSGVARNPGENRLTRQVLPDVIKNYDDGRPYLPSSPYISDAYYKEAQSHVEEPVLPENHLWGPRDYFKGTYYRDTFCHFASEIGYHGFPAVDSLQKFLKEPEKIFEPDGTPTEEYMVHASAMEAKKGAPYTYRIRLAYDQVVTLFGKACENLEDFVLQSQISQAEAKKYFIEKFRTAKWERTGIIWWNLLDGWPQVSDAIVDYYFTKKLAYSYIKRSQQPVCLMGGEEVENTLPLYAVNDTPKEVSLNYTVYRILDGRKKTEREGSIVLTPDTAQVLDHLLLSNRQECFLFTWKYDKIQGSNHYYTKLLNIDLEEYKEALKMCEF